MTTRTCAFPFCEASLSPGEADDGWSTRALRQVTLDPTEWLGRPDITYDLCPEHGDYEKPPLDLETYPIWDPHWGPVPDWVIEERNRRAEEREQGH